MFQGNPFSDGELLIALPRLVGIVFSEGGRCAGDDERARCEGARAIDRSLLQIVNFSDHQLPSWRWTNVQAVVHSRLT